MMTRPESNGSAPNTARAISVRPGADQPGDPKDFAPAHLQANIGQHDRILVLGVASPGQALDAEHDIADSRPLAPGKKAHSLDDQR